MEDDGREINWNTEKEGLAWTCWEEVSYGKGQSRPDPNGTACSESKFPCLWPPLHGLSQRTGTDHFRALWRSASPVGCSLPSPSPSPHSSPLLFPQAASRTESERRREYVLGRRPNYKPALSGLIWAKPKSKTWASHFLFTSVGGPFPSQTFFFLSDTTNIEGNRNRN